MKGLDRVWLEAAMRVGEELAPPTHPQRARMNEAPTEGLEQGGLKPDKNQVTLRKTTPGSLDLIKYYFINFYLFLYNLMLFYKLSRN